MTVQQHIIELATSAKAACPTIANSPVSQRNEALLRIAEALETSRTALLKANKLDLESAAEAGLDSALIDRLELNDARITGMLDALSIVRS